ncbi:MAG: CidA/LrgA family protein [Gemmiger sp.]
MKYLFQFARLAAFCLAGELLHTLLPLPVPASIYGLALLLAALVTGLVKLEQVRETALFLTGIFPVLFVPAAAGVMDLLPEISAMLLPIVLAVFPVTLLVMAVAGRVTQRLARKGGNRHAE